jgi:hypothetical protein
MRDHPISLPLPPMSRRRCCAPCSSALPGRRRGGRRWRRQPPDRHVLPDRPDARWRATGPRSVSAAAMCRSPGITCWPSAPTWRRCWARPFPFRLAGAIHVDNALSAGIQPVPGRPLDLATTVEVGPPAANGAVHAALATRALQDGEPVFSCRSTYLVVRGRRSGGPHAPARRAAAWRRWPAGSCRRPAGASTPRCRATGTRSICGPGRRA